MSAIWTIAKREILSFFVSPIAYVVLTVWTIINGFNFYIFSQFYATQASSGGSDNPVTAFFGGTTLFYLGVLVFVPVITMRLLAEERRGGTIEPLLTAPVSDVSVVFGKYLAAMAFWVVMWLPTLLYVWITSNYGDVDLGAIGASYFGVLMLGTYYIAIGLLMSAVSSNQIVSAVLSFLALGTLFTVGLFEFVATDSQEVWKYLSIWSHMDAYSKGIVDSRYVVFALSLAVLALFLTVRVVGGLRARARERSTTYMAIGSLAVLALFLMANYLSYRHFDRWDWTTDQRYTLSDRTEQVLRELEREVEIFVFMSPGDSSYADVHELLTRYQAVSDRVSVTFVDPHREEAEFRLLLQRFGVRAAQLETGEIIADVAAVVASGDQNLRVGHDDLVTTDLSSFGGDEAPQIDIKAERAFTGTILQVVSGGPTRVCVATGHGEWTLEGGSERSLTALRDEIRRDNVELEALDLAGAGATLPDHCEAVFVIGPLRPFSAEEADRLAAYARRGGNLLLALDPVIERDRIQDTGLEDALRGLGVRVESALAVEPDANRRLAAMPYERFLVADYGEHRSTAALVVGQMPSVVQMARPISAIEGRGATPLLMTSADGFGMVDLARLDPSEEPTRADADVPGPVTLAVAVELPAADEAAEEEEEGGSGRRVVVVGDADWLRGEYVQTPMVANAFLASSLIGWLTEREALISIPPRRASLAAVMMSEADLDGLFLRVVVLIPSAMLLLGFAVWWSRRS